MSTKRMLTQSLLRFQRSVSGPSHAHRIIRPFSSAPRCLARPGGGAANRDPFSEIEEKEWAFDDLSALGHAELDQHREAREYARLAVYEMPRLTQFVRPFEPPTNEQVLRFRYTTYMGEKHPAESKVVVEFFTNDLGLEEVSRQKLMKLCGTRYNPETNTVKLACEMFETQAQNKKYLSDVVDRLVAEAKDLTDKFEDIPLDLRHHKKKSKVKPKFPVGWRMTNERREMLRLEREGLLKALEDSNAAEAAAAAATAADGVTEGPKGAPAGV